MTTATPKELTADEVQLDEELELDEKPVEATDEGEDNGVTIQCCGPVKPLSPPEE